MAANSVTYTWSFPKVDQEFYYAEMKKLGDALSTDSDSVFAYDIQIVDLADDSRAYIFHIVVPELHNFAYRLFEVKAKPKGKGFDIECPGISTRDQVFKGKTQKEFVQLLQKLVQENSIRNDLALYYTKVAEIRLRNKDFGKTA